VDISCFLSIDQVQNYGIVSLWAEPPPRGFNLPFAACIKPN